MHQHQARSNCQQALGAPSKDPGIGATSGVAASMLSAPRVVTIPFPSSLLSSCFGLVPSYLALLKGNNPNCVEIHNIMTNEQRFNQILEILTSMNSNITKLEHKMDAIRDNNQARIKELEDKMDSVLTGKKYYPKLHLNGA